MPSQDTATGARGWAARWSWLLPAGTFLAGCALGAVVTGVGQVGTADDPAPSAAGSAADGTPDEDPVDPGGGPDEDGGVGEDLTVRVPAVCVQTADDASALVDSVDDLVSAIADFDPGRLRRTVDDVQQIRDEVQDEAEQCRKAAAEQVRGSSGSGSGSGSASEDEGAAPATPSS